METKLMKTSLISFTVLWASAWLCLGEAEVGKPAPPFTGKDIQGQTHRLADYKGKIVILEAYNHDCPFCANHFNTGAMQELQEKVTADGNIWLMVNSSYPKSGSYRTPAAAQKEFKDLKMKATAWLDDSSGEIGKAYGLKTTPHMVVIDAHGKVVYNGAIDDRPETEGDPRKARNYVMEAYGALKAGQPVEVTRTRPYGCGVKYGN